MAGSHLTVLQMLPALHGGGVERGTLEVAQALVRAGHRALVMSAGGPMVAPLTRLGAEHIEWPVGDKSPFTLRLVPRLRRLLVHEGVDVVHPRSRVPAWVAWLAWRAMVADSRPRFVTTVHGFYSVSGYSAVMTRGEKVICVSRAILEYVRNHYPHVPEDRLVVIPRGIDSARFPHGYRPDPSWMARWNATAAPPANRRTLLLPGRITRRKGHEAFIELLATLTAGGLDVHGLVAGGEDPRRKRYAAELRRRVRALGLEERISFLGHRDDIRELMAISDLVLSLSSKPESFGRTVLEALSLGRPTIGYAHGGVAEILHALYPQGAVPAGNTARLADTARTLLTEPPPVPDRHAYPLSDMLQRTLALYRALAGETAG